MRREMLVLLGLTAIAACGPRQTPSAAQRHGPRALRDVTYERTPSALPETAV